MEANNEFLTQIKDPLDSIKKVQHLVINKEYEAAIELINKVILLKLSQIENNKLSYEMIPYYIEYAKVLIAKIASNEELFAANNDEKQEDESNAEQSENAENNKGDGEEEDKNSDDEKDEESSEEDANDEETTYDLLFSCQKIIKNQIADYEKENNENVNNNEKIKSSQLQLADTYILFSELESALSKNKEAISYLEKALELRQKYDSKLSRAIGEIYYLIAGNYDFDIYKCFTNLYKLKVVLEYNLQEQLNKEFLGKTKVPIFYYPEEEALLDLNFIDYQGIKLNINSTDIEVNDMDTDEIQDLKLILLEIYQKVML